MANATTGQWAPPGARLTPDQWNDLWWAYRLRYQGVAPPVNRTAASFDPGAKFHVPNAVPYMRYFLSENIQFQFHKSLCNRSGYVGPLSNCSIAGSKEAGNALWGMLSLGSSRPWPEALFNLTGARAQHEARQQAPLLRVASAERAAPLRSSALHAAAAGSRNMSSAALREYFQPLYNWLLVNNSEAGLVRASRGRQHAAMRRSCSAAGHLLRGCYLNRFDFALFIPPPTDVRLVWGGLGAASTTWHADGADAGATTEAALASAEAVAAKASFFKAVSPPCSATCVYRTSACTPSLGAGALFVPVWVVTNLAAAVPRVCSRGQVGR